MGLQNKITAVI